MSKRLDPETKAANKIKFGQIRSERMKGAGNPFYGKHHTQESIDKISVAKIGTPSNRLGAHHTDEAKEKLRMSHFGKAKVARTSVQPDDLAIRYIPLTKGHYAIVDADDYERINAFLWVSHHDKNSDYAQHTLPKCNGKQRNEKLHHAIMGIPPKGLMIDHINGNGLDNRKSNLRLVSNRANCANHHYRKRSSKYPGCNLE